MFSKNKILRKLEIIIKKKVVDAIVKALFLEIQKFIKVTKLLCNETSQISIQCFIKNNSMSAVCFSLYYLYREKQTDRQTLRETHRERETERKGKRGRERYTQILIAAPGSL